MKKEPKKDLIGCFVLSLINKNIEPGFLLGSLIQEQSKESQLMSVLENLTMCVLSLTGVIDTWDICVAMDFTLIVLK